MTAENYAEMSVDELTSKFIVLDRMERDLSRRLGIIYYHLGQKLGIRVGRYKEDTIYSTLMKAGATRSMIARASSYAKVYNDVISGILSVDEYSSMTLLKIMDYNRAIHPTKNSAPLFHNPPKATQIQQSAGLKVWSDNLDEEILKSPESVNAALEAAQEWLFAARDRLPEGQKRWDDFLSAALNSIGRIRYEAAEIVRESAPRRSTAA